MKTEQEKLSDESNIASGDFNTGESHNKIKSHLEEASKQHSNAVKHSEEGDVEKEIESIIHAQHHTSLAAEAQTEMLKHFPFTS